MYKYLILFFIFAVLFERSLCDCGGDVCSLPLVEPGRCRAAIVRYGFDGKKCRKFIWGGCDGNENSFDNIHQCIAACETPWDPDN